MLTNNFRFANWLNVIDSSSVDYEWFLRRDGIVAADERPAFLFKSAVEKEKGGEAD